jgi:hypothetical protein
MEVNGVSGVVIEFEGISNAQILRYVESEEKGNHPRSGIFEVNLSKLTQFQIERIIKIFAFGWWNVFHSEYSTIFLDEKIRLFANNCVPLSLTEMEFIHQLKMMKAKKFVGNSSIDCGGTYCHYELFKTSL